MSIYTLVLQEKKGVNAHQFVNVLAWETEMKMLWVRSLILKYNFTLFYWFRRGYVTFLIQKIEKKICKYFMSTGDILKCLVSKVCSRELYLMVNLKNSPSK